MFAEFERFTCDNREWIVPPRPRIGYLCLGKHLGKPLDESLWTDLTEKLRIESLRIYLHGETPDAICWYACCLFLDEQKNLADIWYAAAVPNRKAGAVFESKMI